MAIGTLLSLVPAAYGTYKGIQENEEIAGIARRNARRGDLQQQASLKAIRDIDFSPSQSIADAAQNRLEYGERLGVEAARRGDTVSARTIAALGENERLLRASGPRAYQAGLDHALEGEMKGVDVKTQADMFMADAAQRGLDQSRQRDLSVDQFMLEQGAAAYNAGIQGEMAAKAARGEALARAGVAATEALLAMPGKKKSTPGGDGTGNGDDGFEYDYGPVAAADQRPGMFVDAPGLEAGEQVDLGRALQDVGYGSGDNYNFDPVSYDNFDGPSRQELRDYRRYDRMLRRDAQTDDIDDYPAQTGVLPYGGFQFREQGGYIGENGGVTEGEFSHDTNKKAVIDEESGEKEGELTGGEVVFNPKQTDKIEDFIEDRDADGLLQYMTMLFSLPQFQEA